MKKTKKGCFQGFNETMLNGGKLLHYRRLIEKDKREKAIIVHQTRCLSQGVKINILSLDGEKGLMHITSLV
jgi:hypothetical protein